MRKISEKLNQFLLKILKWVNSLLTKRILKFILPGSAKELKNLKLRGETILLFFSVSLYGVVIVTVLKILGIRVEYLQKLKDGQKLIDGVEPVSIFIGLIGIVLSWIIFIYVKQESDINQQQSNEKIENLNSSVGKMNNFVISIDNSTKTLEQLLQQYSSLVPIQGLKDRLEKIEEIYLHAVKNKNNNLWVMTMPLNYGNLLAHEIASLYYYETTEPINTYMDLKGKPMKSIRDKIEAIRDLLINNVGSLAERTQILSLPKEQYSTMIGKILDKNRRVKGKYKYSEEQFDFNKVGNDYYYFFKNEDEETKDEDINDARGKVSLINYLEGRNEGDYRDFLSRLGSKSVRFKDSIPFQFIASIPTGKEGPTKYEGKCLILFSNLYNGSDNDTTTCFYSTNEKLIKNLENIFKNYFEKTGTGYYSKSTKQTDIPQN